MPHKARVYLTSKQLARTEWIGKLVEEHTPFPKVLHCFYCWSGLAMGKELGFTLLVEA